MLVGLVLYEICLKAGNMLFKLSKGMTNVHNQ